MTLNAPIPYGEEDIPTEQVHGGTVVALFNATATPEDKVHGAFLAAIAARLGQGATLVAVVDESAFRARLGNDPLRLAARRKLWSELCSDRRVPHAFADLAGGTDVAEAEAQFEAALEETVR